ncbi:glycosyltransferase family 4 protein [Limnoglobus roseus]|uniref:GT4 family glycosyltransferase n=1 Tax=Limnoglobus roseus TaxID=2598579 RepID=A0A5C1AF08_9BACT|nr:glycosyltransferase family 4 protein [Limnoglobus roseus]QEL17135.1 GT4 family glycosyltransferase [Limnoglobus roseus]
MNESLPTSGRLTVSVVTGVVVDHDAISNICRQQIEVLDRYARQHQMALDLKLFLHGTTAVEPRAVRVEDPVAIVCDPHFQRSDVVIYHFGIYYPLFDSLAAAPRTARVIVNYYGITPPGLTSPDSHDVLHRSFRQAAQMFNADRILVNSRFIGAEALAMGFAPNRVHHLPLSAAFPIPETISVKAPGDVLRIAYLGRIVPAKGVRELLAAAARFAEGRTPFHLTLMGARRYSCPVVIGEAEAAAKDGPLAGKLELLLDRPGDEVRQQLAGADLFVMPSHHEGFCVPVVEAISCGTALVHSNAAALPETAGGLGLSFPAGNADALLACLGRAAEHWAEGLYPTDDGPMAPGAWRAKALAHLRTFSREHFSETFLRHALAGVQPLSPDRAGLRGDVRLQTMLKLCGTAPRLGGNPVSIGEHLQAVLASPRRPRPRRNRTGRPLTGSTPQEVRS